ncbi:MAG: methyl-accepting chemotaxis protein [Bacteroidota bacterium]
MNLRYRLTLQISGFILASIVAAGVYASQIYGRAVERDYIRRMEPILEATKAAIDPAVYAGILAAKDESAPEYQNTLAGLRRVVQRYGLMGIQAVSMDKQKLYHIVIDTDEGGEHDPVWNPTRPPNNKEANSALAGEDAIEAFTKSGGQRVMRGFVSIKGGGQVLGYAVCTLGAEQASRAMGLVARDVLLGGIFMLIMGVVFAFILANKLTQPLMSLTEHAERLLAGDLTQELDVRHEGEIGVIAKAMDRMQTGLRRLASKVQEMAGDLTRQADQARQHAHNLRLATEQASATIAEISEGVRHSASTVSESTQELATSSAVLDNLDKQVAELQGSVLDVRSLALRGAEVVGGVVDGIAAVEEETKRAAERMQDFIQRTQGIGEMIEAIENIATQTATLALNATIEAARAGDYGRGFAVVARRIQRLAVSAKETVVGIRELLGGLNEIVEPEAGQEASAQDGATKATPSLRSLQEAFGVVVAKLEQLTTRLADVAVARGELTRNAARVNEAMRTVRELSSQATDGIVQTSAATTEMGEAVNQLVVMVNALGQSADALIEEAKRFKV